MRTTKLELNLDDLNVDTFGTTDPGIAPLAESRFYHTVLYETEQLSCGGSCGSCPCYA
ncbi:MAG TPA: hypothetical protein VE913_19450 [Longimicrobium sp.]|nr:hypothetical protein [Longimicrobium sp.]